MKTLVTLITVTILMGCAQMPVGQRLGLDQDEKIERLPRAVTMIAPPVIDTAEGYLIEMPSGWYERETSCKLFSTLDGKDVPICRKASRATIIYKNGSIKQASALVHEHNYLVFTGKGVSEIRIHSADGTQNIVKKTSQLDKLTSRELRKFYGFIADDFPWMSKTVPGTNYRLMYGLDSLDVLNVPSLLTFEEKASYCGLFSISTSEILGVANMNPLALLSKAWAGVCTARAKPRILSN